MTDLLDGVKIVFDANKKVANKGEILVGLGNTQISNEGVVLQHKTTPEHYDSLSRYVYTLPMDLDTKQLHTFYIEDLSVDTVISIWIFLLKIKKLALAKNIVSWIDYASRWERGDTTTTGKPFESYGCLQNALVSYLAKSKPDVQLEESLSFLDYLVKHNIDPAKIPKNLSDDFYQKAYKALEKEYGKYEFLVRKSEVAVLNIPQKDNSGVRKVSAIFIETDIVTSIHKVFLRNDVDNSPTKDGFALMAVYNEVAAGTGNDIVISVDPDKKIHLKDLWVALENEENKCWEGKRPMDSPRPLISYPDNNGPNEPWWDDMGNYTLIAAPKMIGEQYGRCVDWYTVKTLIKQLYAKGERS